MVIVPAVAVGAFVVFCAGYVLTYSVLNFIAKRKKGVPTLYRDTLEKVDREVVLTEEDIDKVAKVGGAIAVVMLVLSIFIVPREWVIVIWGGLTVVGIVVGILTFLLR